MRARVQLCRQAFSWACGLFSCNTIWNSVACDSLCRQRHLPFRGRWWGQSCWRCFMGCLMFPRTPLFAIIWKTPQAVVSCPKTVGFGLQPCLKETPLGFARFIFEFSLAVFHSSNFLWILRRQRGSRGIWLGSWWGQQPLDKQEQDRKAETSQALKKGCFAFSTAWSCCTIINPAQHYCQYPPLLLLLSLRLKTVGTSVQFNFKMFSLFCFPELLRLQIRCSYFKHRITVLPKLE